ncbi:MAG: S24/S26 family peptidase [bacterium]
MHPSPVLTPSSLSWGHNLFCEVCSSLLLEGYAVRFSAPGRSMYPTILDGDAVTVHPVKESVIRRGHILLCRYKGRVIAHRVVRIERRDGNTPLYTLRGDSHGAPEEVVDAGDVLGMVRSVERSGRSIDVSRRQPSLPRIARSLVSRIARLLS